MFHLQAKMEYDNSIYHDEASGAVTYHDVNGRHSKQQSIKVKETMIDENPTWK